MHSFNSRRKLVDLKKYLRRLADLTSPNPRPIEGDSRANGRQNRVLPTILIPWENGAPLVTDSATVLTKDVSDHGVGLVLHQPFRAQHVVIGLWLVQEESPWFFLGEVRHNSSIGGGYWAIGVQLAEVLDPIKFPALERLFPVVAKLLPAERQCRPRELVYG